MNINNVKALFYAVTATIGGLVTHLLGGWSHDMNTLLIFMAIDFISGLALATIFKNSTKTHGGALESRACMKGLFRKGMILVFVMVGNRLDLTLGTDYIRTTVIIGFIANELISIIENAGLMGVKFPKVISDSVEILKSKSGDDKKEVD